MLWFRRTAALVACALLASLSFLLAGCVGTRTPSRSVYIASGGTLLDVLDMGRSPASLKIYFIRQAGEQPGMRSYTLTFEGSDTYKIWSERMACGTLKIRPRSATSLLLEFKGHRQVLGATSDKVVKDALADLNQTARTYHEVMPAHTLGTPDSFVSLLPTCGTNDR